MQSETDPIKSIRQTLAGGYQKPDVSRVKQFVDALESHTPALDYLKVTRGLSENTIKHFKLGYCQERDSISIPVYKSGELVNIRYRSLNEISKQRYTQEKGCEVWLFNDDGVEKGKDKGGVLIVEGEFDLMSAWQAGFKNVVSPASGKDSYGVWIELLDSIPRVYIAYDNDSAGKSASMNLAERIGVDKSFEVLYPDGFKDANEYFLKHSQEDFRKLLVTAQPYYKHKFSGVGDIITSLMQKPEPRLELDSVPFVRWKDDWLAVLSADSGFGKTTYALNIANELANKDIPTLVLPFERGIKEVGERYLQVRYEKQEEDLSLMIDSEWESMKEDAIELPLYFSMPSQQDFWDTVRRAKRIFDIKFIVVDHLDYFVRGNDKVSKQADFMHQLKELCIEVGVCAIVVHHINKPEGRRKKKLEKEDMKGSSDIYQIAEVVILMYEGDNGRVVIDVVKNKGKQGKRMCLFDMTTGKMKSIDDVSDEELAQLEREAEEAWMD